ncbi:hypothetical protein ACP70R_007475 [Stipagrostis hirtigluma subsp. patula]
MALTGASKPSLAPAAAAAALLLPALLAACAWTPALAQRVSGVTAMYVAYNAPSVNWDLAAASASCAAQDGDKPREWRSRYWWTAFCGPAGPRGDAACGRCLTVANAATGAQATVRIVDDCDGGDAALGMDTPVFYQIDTDGRGMANGKLEVNYEFVDCHD